jgi:hypothetical protein
MPVGKLLGNALQRIQALRSTLDQVATKPKPIIERRPVPSARDLFERAGPQPPVALHSPPVVSVAAQGATIPQSAATTAPSGSNRTSFRNPEDLQAYLNGLTPEQSRQWREAQFGPNYAEQALAAAVVGDWLEVSGRSGGLAENREFLEKSGFRFGADGEVVAVGNQVSSLLAGIRAEDGWEGTTDPLTFMTAEQVKAYKGAERGGLLGALTSMGELGPGVPNERIPEVIRENRSRLLELGYSAGQIEDALGFDYAYTTARSIAFQRAASMVGVSAEDRVALMREIKAGNREDLVEAVLRERAEGRR